MAGAIAPRIVAGDAAGILDPVSGYSDQGCLTYLKTTPRRLPVRLRNAPCGCGKAGTQTRYLNWVRGERYRWGGVPLTALKPLTQTAVLQGADKYLFFWHPARLGCRRKTSTCAYPARWWSKQRRR